MVFLWSVWCTHFTMFFILHFSFVFVFDSSCLAFFPFEWPCQIGSGHSQIYSVLHSRVPFQLNTCPSFQPPHFVLRNDSTPRPSCWNTAFEGASNCLMFKCSVWSELRFIYFLLINKPFGQINWRSLYKKLLDWLSESSWCIYKTFNLFKKINCCFVDLMQHRWYVVYS